MITLYKNVFVVYPKNEWDGKKIDILVSKGKILEIGKSLQTKSDRTIKAKNLICLPSMIDLQCSIGEPGHEYKETLESASRAAYAGGFSKVVMLPNTKPAIDSKAQILFVKNQRLKLKTEILTYGSVTKACEGNELSEMYDMQLNGAVAFSDGKKPIEDVNMMRRALEYALNFNGLVCSFPKDQRLNPGGMVHESANNTNLGIKSTPALAEEIMLNRDLHLLEYTNSRLHVSTISTAGSTRLIKEGKSKGLHLTAAVAMPNLLYTDINLKEFDSNYKTDPPLREVSDRKALIKAIKAGTIDVIITDHCPENIENKSREFDHAKYGMTMLETALSLINMHLIPDLEWTDVVRTMSINPRNILGLESPRLEKGSDFDFVVFNPDEQWVYEKGNCQSKSHNSPVIGEELIGRVIR